MMVPFTPLLAGTATLSLPTAATSVSVSINAAASALELQNPGSDTVFVRWGVGAQTAVATTDYPVLAGQSKIVSVPVGADTLAGITASGAGAATLYVTSGEGF